MLLIGLYVVSARKPELSRGVLWYATITNNEGRLMFYPSTRPEPVKQAMCGMLLAALRCQQMP